MATNRVRDMYEADLKTKIRGIDDKNKIEKIKKQYRDEKLKDNPDVLFKIYRKAKLHVLLFTPSHPVEWKRVIYKHTTLDTSVQLTVRRAVKGDLPIINMSGSEDELQYICDRFAQLYNEVRKYVQNPKAELDEIEELIARIRELELENKNLRRQLDEAQS
ncbi:hypothetical protein PHYPO_G00211370 [Pangasianodon hypophthalmus]|uniref:Uncharacterized protein n=1 Tax=Pangasianodon hypophthalmus TaxID=310915 RepID=A0A5N5P6R3_PANHP|nr:hypothetical protein PHYPO_G00211370 [Pangasianodon hypophthalmus]